MPYLYNTWWIYLIISLLIPSAGYIVFKLKLLQLERTNLQINQLLLSKIAELQDSTQKLGALERAIQSDDQQDEQMLAVLLHDIRSPLRFLSTISKAVLKECSNGSMETNQDHLLKLYRSVGALRSFVEESYIWVRSSEKALHLSIRQISIQDVFNKMEGFYGEFLSFNDNKLIVSPTDLYWNTDLEVLCLILRNLLDNANKHTEGGKVWLSCFTQNGKLCIQLKDSGNGLNERQIQAFLHPCMQDERTSMGSQVISRMLKKINGRLHITSQVGKGSVFTIELSPVAIETDYRHANQWTLSPKEEGKYLVGELA